MAQWEEYHTHVLPHCAGNWLGVTEVNYSLGVLAFVNSFLDRKAFYTRSMETVLAQYGDTITQHVPDIILAMELRGFLLSIWGIMSLGLMFQSVVRVLTHPRVATGSAKETLTNRLKAISKLATPFALCMAAFLVPPSAVRTRYISVTLGLAFSILTKKMIVFSMAKMAFAIVQWDAAPFLLAAVWIRFDERLTKMGADFLLGVLCFWYTWRLLRWANVTIHQICVRLDINCFTIKKKKQV
jgi:hypothetical protein|mmetsp:Transcript_17839/g.38511  ORF Transcript_17839/g.38511 Transcript_17839/m.38511 type:complete len:241 (+) Transcript_17839:737-1459(+)